MDAERHFIIGDRVAIVELHVADRSWRRRNGEAITGRLDAEGERDGAPCYWVETTIEATWGRHMQTRRVVLMATEIVSLEPLVIEGVTT